MGIVRGTGPPAGKAMPSMRWNRGGVEFGMQAETHRADGKHLIQPVQAAPK